jgi:hypothetical protein
MILGICMRKQIIADADFLLRQQETLVILLKEFPRADAAFVGLNENRRAVTVRTGHHQHAIALETMVAGKNVRREIRSGQMPHVEIAIRIGPGHRDMDVFGHDGAFILRCLDRFGYSQKRQ